MALATPIKRGTTRAGLPRPTKQPLSQPIDQPRTAIHWLRAEVANRLQSLLSSLGQAALRPQAAQAALMDSPSLMAKSVSTSQPAYLTASKQMAQSLLTYPLQHSRARGSLRQTKRGAEAAYGVACQLQQSLLPTNSARRV